MEPSSIHKLLRKFITAINDKDWDEVRNCLHPEVKEDSLIYEEIRDTGLEVPKKQTYSRKEYIERLKTTVEGLQDHKVDIQRIVVERDHAALLVIVSGTHDRPFFGIPPTNSEIEYRVFSHYTFKDGLIIERRSVVNWLAFLRQVGRSILEKNDKHQVKQYLGYLKSQNIIS